MALSYELCFRMPQSFKSWLKKQLAKLDEAERQELDVPDFDGFRSIIYQAERRAAAAGVPNAVAACRKLRPGGISVGLCREVLAACLQAIGSSPDPETTDGPLTVKQAARLLNISVRQLYKLCSDGEIAHTEHPIRILPADLEEYQARSIKAAQPQTRLRVLRP